MSNERLFPEDGGNKNFIISGTNYWNPGDDFVRDGIIAVLRKVFPNHTLSFQFYNFNADFFPQSKFSGIGNFLSKGDLDLCRESVDGIIIAGLSAGNEIKDLYNWIIANRLEKRTFLIGAGYENNYVARHVCQEPEATIFRNARIIIGRTEKTPEYFAKHDVPYRRINCPAILSVPSVKVIPAGRRIEKIGFSIQLSHEQGLVNHACDKEQSELATSILIELSKTYSVEVVAHHKSEYFHFLRLLRGRSIPVVFSSFYQDLFSIYRRYDLVITTRLHSSLFANGHGIPGIIINDTDRHTHTLEGFPHSVWVPSRATFDLEFEKLQHQDLAQIAFEAQEFKKNLIKKYVEALAPAFELRTGASEELPIHFLTIVLNGKPFIGYHIERFKQLSFRWHWHIVEGVAELKHDTAWAMETGGRISGEIHHNGLSNDGTTEYLDKLAQEFPENITIYRKPPDQFWDGKLEMVNKPLENIQEPCLIWQVDADELWTADQLYRGRALFVAHPDRTAAYYFCHYFVGENRVISTRGTYGNHPEYEWLRTWRFAPGMQWTAHEPPRLCRKADGKWLNLAEIHPFTHEETEFNELVFQHYAYVTPAQLQFKQIYYGYQDALSRWKRLQAGNLPLQLKEYFAWVKDEAQVSSAQSQGIVPLAQKDQQGIWQFESSNAAPRPNSKRILLMRTDSIGDNVLATGLLPHLRRKYLGSYLAVFCEESAKEIYQDSTFVDEVLCFNWKLSLADKDYRQVVAANVRNFKADLVINSVFSRDILSDQFVPVGTGAEIVALEGDLSNMSEGDQKCGNQFYTRLFPSPGKSKPEFERHLDLLAGLGIESKQFSTRLCPSLENRRWAKELFQEHDLDPLKTIALFPGAKYNCKIYRRYPAALRRLKGFRFLVFGGSEVTGMAEQIVAALPGSLNLCGKTTLLEMAAAMQKCRMYVGSDSSGAHIACAVGLPNLVVMGGGHFGRFFPYASLTSVVCLPLDCYGCNWSCIYKNDCIARIDPRVIFKAVRQVLASSSVKSRIFAQTSIGANFRLNRPQCASAHQWIDSDKVEWIPIKQGIFQRLQTAILALYRQAHLF